METIQLHCMTNASLTAFPAWTLGYEPPSTSRTCVIWSTVVAWCLLFVTTERYGLPFVFPWSLIMGKKGNYTERTVERLTFPLSGIISTLWDLSHKNNKPKHSCIILDFMTHLSNWVLPSGGRLNCTLPMRFRAHQTLNGWGSKKKKSMKAQIQRRHLGAQSAPLNTPRSDGRSR